jgi:protein-S-isoprenylcysteine O-methyltransferase Ste14
LVSQLSAKTKIISNFFMFGDLQLGPDNSIISLSKNGTEVGMLIQIIIVLLFALNLGLIWLGRFQKFLNWYRYPGGAFFVLLPLSGVFFSQPFFELDFFWWRIAGAAAIILGAALIVWALRVAGLMFPAGEPSELKTDGPFALVRHPVYLGLVFIFVGWWWLWAAVYSFYFGMLVLALIWTNAYLEEKLVLDKAFGRQYAEYRSQTGMFWVK